MTSEFGGIAEGMRNISLHNENDKPKIDEDKHHKGDALQEKAIALAKEGRNMFLTGKAGTGKSWTIRQIVRESCDSAKRIQLTAPTGIAAINIGGKTIHSWGGFQLGEHYKDFNRMMREQTRRLIQSTDMLLIDEISMVDGHLFDVLECMVTIIRCYDEVKDRLKNIQLAAIGGKEIDGSAIMSPHLLDMRWKKSGDGLGDLPPWGGLQLIVVGDFFQLPPVPNASEQVMMGGGGNDNEDDDDDESYSDEFEFDDHRKIGRQGSYAFESRVWQKSGLHTVELEEVHRQADNDDGLLELLNDMREGKIDDKLLLKQHQQQQHRVASAIDALRTPLPPRDDGIVPTELHARNRDVDRVNNFQLSRLTGQLQELRSLDEVVLGYEYKRKLLKKYRLLGFSDMPYLFASVEAPPPTPSAAALDQARQQLDALETKKEELKATEDYEASIALRPQLVDLTKRVEGLDTEEKKKSEISVSSIARYLDQRSKLSSTSNNPSESKSELESSRSSQHEAEALYESFRRFDKQLQHDFNVLEEHARVRFFQKGCRVKDKITLKENSQVMLLWNLDVDQKLANGSRGVLQGFVPLASYRRLLQQEFEKPQPVENDPKKGNSGPLESAGRKKCIPCICEYSNASIGNESKASKEAAPKGTKTSTAEDDNHHSIDPEIMYGHSLHPEDLLPTLEDDYDYSIDPETLKELKAHVKLLSAQKLLEEEKRTIDKASIAGMTVLPYVRFTKDRKRLILPVPFNKEFKGCGHASRWQIPLCLAWAISIHKSQGMTIDWLHVNLKGCFANGQAYVACSRGESLKSMTVKNFDFHEIKTSESVKRFYKSLSGGCEPYTTTWCDTIEAFDNACKLKKELEKRYKDKRCEWCGARCFIRQVKKKNYNKGKFFVACPEGNSGQRNHHFEWIPVKSRHP